MRDPNAPDQKNLIIAVLLSMLVIGGWQYLIVRPEVEKQRIVREAQRIEEQAKAAATDTAVAPNAPASATPAAILTEATAAPRDEVLTRAARIAINGPRVTGSISLLGGRIDDLHLADYKVTQKPGAETVLLLNPAGSVTPYYAVFGWASAAKAPDARTEWMAPAGATLTRETPVTLSWDNGEGLLFQRTFSIDDNFMFTVRESVKNYGTAAAALVNYGTIARHGEQKTGGFFVVHEGALAMTDGELRELDYSEIDDLPTLADEGGRAQQVSVTKAGWIGFTDKYWMTALIPAADQGFQAVFKRTESRSGQVYQTDVRYPALTVESGEEKAIETRLFAGAKEYKTIGAYEKGGIDRFIDAIDWGWFWYLTKPFFWLLNIFNSALGNMGLAIISLTVLVKAVMFPLAYKSYASMSKMKKLQPEMQALKERHGDDRATLQKAIMELYRKEKINPAAGCLPILLQIPVFFALYKVLFVTIEMRHAPFFGWITDLAAPDPTSVFNLFGLLPWAVPAFLLIGVWPLLMGVTMWFQQKLSPPATDPVQDQIMSLLPIMFTFMLASFPAGLVIYWTLNNLLTILQQLFIMKRQGVEIDLFGNVKRGFKRREPTSGKG